MVLAASVVLSARVEIVAGRARRAKGVNASLRLREIALVDGAGIMIIARPRKVLTRPEGRVAAVLGASVEIVAGGTGQLRGRSIGEKIPGHRQRNRRDGQNCHGNETGKNASLERSIPHGTLSEWSCMSHALGGRRNDGIGLAVARYIRFSRYRCQDPFAACDG